MDIGPTAGYLETHGEVDTLKDSRNHCGSSWPTFASTVLVPQSHGLAFAWG